MRGAITTLGNRYRDGILVQLFLTWSHELVPNSRSGKNQLRPLGIEFQLSAKARYVRVDRASGRTALMAPNRPQKFDARDGTSGAFHQIVKELELATRKLDWLSVSHDFFS